MLLSGKQIATLSKLTDDEELVEIEQSAIDQAFVTATLDLYGVAERRVRVFITGTERMEEEG